MSEMGEADDAQPDDDKVRVSLPVMAWAEVSAALQLYLNVEPSLGSRRDALASLQEIDRVMCGATEPAPPDDLLRDLPRLSGTGKLHISASYWKSGDQLKLYWNDAPSWADELDERQRITVLRDFKDEKLITGCKVWGLSEVLDKAGLKLVPK